MISFYYIMEKLAFSIYQQFRIMNFNQINRSSLINSLYANRNNYLAYTQNDTNKVQITQQHHLNPSKSKVNIKQSLNKTIENCKIHSSIIVDIKNRSILNNNPVSASNQLNNDSFDEDKYFKSGKDSNGSYTDRTFNKQNKCKNYQIINPFPIFDDKRKSESFHVRNESRNDFRLKFDGDKRNDQKDKQNSFSQINQILHKLLKRMTNNEEELFKLKQKMESDKSAIIIGDQMSGFRAKVMQIVENNYKRETEIDIKFKEQLKEINALKDILSQNDKNIYKNTMRIVKSQEDINQVKSQTIANLYTQIQQNKLANIRIANQIQTMKTLLQQQKDGVLKLNGRIIHQDFSLNQIGKQQRKSSRKSSNSICLGNKEILQVNYVQQMKKQKTSQIITLKESKFKRYLEYYYIDTNGYLLDENKFYLLNKNNQPILIKESLLQILKLNQIIMKN